MRRVWWIPISILFVGAAATVAGVALTGTVERVDPNVITIPPDRVLGPGEILRVYTGDENSTAATDLGDNTSVFFSGIGPPEIWSNWKDTATLADGDSQIIDSLEYTSSSLPRSERTASSVRGGDLLADVLASITVEPESQVEYQADLFPHWSDLNLDGCDTRFDVLIRDAAGTATTSGCDVIDGLWYSPYDGVWVTHPDHLRVDHVVPLREAWQSGAHEWTRQQREQFANNVEPHSLTAVSIEAQLDKGDKDPDTWLPDNGDDRCRFLVAWVTVKADWDLSMDQEEYDRIDAVLGGGCRGARTGNGLPIRPTPPNRATSSASPSGVVIDNVVFDADWTVLDTESLEFIRYTGEYVQIRNLGTERVGLGGWTISDEAGTRSNQLATPLKAVGIPALFIGLVAAWTVARHVSQSEAATATERAAAETLRVGSKALVITVAVLGLGFLVFMMVIIASLS